MSAEFLRQSTIERINREIESEIVALVELHDQPLDADTRALLEPLITHLALSRSINATWVMLALACVVPALACAIAWLRPRSAR